MSTTITGLPNASTPLSGAERVPMDQAGATVDATTQDIADLVPGTDLTYTPATRTLASSTGADVVLPEATTSAAGLMSAADKAAIGQATIVTVAVYNNSGVTIPKGAAVYVTGSSGTRVTVALADASVEATAAGTLGLAQAAIGINSEGVVVAVGELTGLNTASLTEGALIWLSETAGQLTTTRPTQPAHGVVLGYCVKQGSGSSGIIYVKVDNGLELDELHDVLITSPAAGQVLRRAADGLWKNSQLAYSDLSGLPSLVAISSATPQGLAATATAGSTGQAADAGHAHQRDTTTIIIPIGDETTALTTGTAKVTFRMPFAATLLEVRASVNTAPTGSTLIFDVNEAGTSVLGTKLSIDATEKTSTTAASTATITDSALADDAEISIDIDQVGSTIAGAGAKVSLIVRRN